MKKAYLRVFALVLVLFLTCAPAFAFEKTLSELGVSDMNVESARTKNCETINFSVPQETLVGAELPIFSIKADYYPTLGGDSRATIKLNDSQEIVIFPVDFTCGDSGCWARVSIPKNEINNQNTGELCVSSGKGTTYFSISSDSKIGFYDTPEFLLKKESPGIIILGQQAKLVITAQNVGSKDANVFVQFISPITREEVNITSFDVVEGESSAHTTIKAGETRDFVFYIKPTIASGYNLPAAVLFFENVFGEEQKIVSNHPQLEVIEPTDIKVNILASKPEGKNFPFIVTIRNTRTTSFEGVLKISNAEHVQGAISSIIIPPSTDKDFSFVAENLSPGNYSLFATVEDENNSYVSNAVSFTISNGGLSIEIWFAIIGVLVSLGLLFYIYKYWKEKY
ncbi:MAG: hypothetical protein WC308_03620 [archaeon]|jgi:hypothetical protein